MEEKIKELEKQIAELKTELKKEAEFRVNKEKKDTLKGAL